MDGGNAAYAGAILGDIKKGDASHPLYASETESKLNCLLLGNAA